MQFGDGPQEHRTEIHAHVKAMKQLAEKLEQSGWSSNHPKLDMNVPRFRTGLELTREAIESQPPKLLLAGSVSAACVYCHGGN
jgi:deoxyribodipyrimidine photolyase-like uncharacterized protein